METQRKTSVTLISRVQRVTVTPMRYALALLALSLVLGGIGHANHWEPLVELATLVTVVSLVAIGHNLWSLARGRRSEQR